MNRIILIGNGFDLAHQMKTSYTHFIDDYWRKQIDLIRETENCYQRTINNEDYQIIEIPSAWFSTAIDTNCNPARALSKSLEKNGYTIGFNNELLKSLTLARNRVNSWVDIESEYYKFLKKCIQKQTRDDSIKLLNKEFERIKLLLIEYLKNIEKEFFETLDTNSKIINLRKDIADTIYSDFYMNDFLIDYKYWLSREIFERLTNFLNMKFREYKYRLFPYKKPKNIQEMLATLSDRNNVQYIDELIPKEILFLSFNYTSTEKEYLQPPQNNKKYRYTKTKVIHIHGLLNDENVSDIIFGFGDELDEDYRKIENINNNEYLTNIKSIRYLNSERYKELLEFINRDDYQIFIFGHSCGISDRTLLNTIFEHPNCKSIKPFYYQRNDGTDNYSDIVSNISRNFTDKTTMRDKVVNKQYTTALFKEY